MAVSISAGLTCAARKLINFKAKWGDNSIERAVCPAFCARPLHSGPHYPLRGVAVAGDSETWHKKLNEGSGGSKRGEVRPLLKAKRKPPIIDRGLGWRGWRAILLPAWYVTYVVTLTFTFSACADYGSAVQIAGICDVGERTQGPETFGEHRCFHRERPPFFNALFQCPVTQLLRYSGSFFFCKCRVVYKIDFGPHMLWAELGLASDVKPCI